MYARSLYEFLTSETCRRRNAPSKYSGAAGRALRGTLVRADGGLIWAIIATSPILDPQGRFSGVLGMLTDITIGKRSKPSTVC